MFNQRLPKKKINPLHLILSLGAEEGIFDLSLKFNSEAGEEIVVPSHFWIIWDVTYNAFMPRVIYDDSNTGNRFELEFKDWIIRVEDVKGSFLIDSSNNKLIYQRYGLDLLSEGSKEKTQNIIFSYGHGGTGTGISRAKLTHTSYVG